MHFVPENGSMGTFNDPLLWRSVPAPCGACSRRRGRRQICKRSTIYGLDPHGLTAGAVHANSSPHALSEPPCAGGGPVAAGFGKAGLQTRGGTCCGFEGLGND